MQVEKVPPVPLRPTFKIELAERDAEILRALVGGVNRVHHSEASTVVTSLYHALTKAGVGHGTSESFSDFFNGAVSCK